jgi:hypothetical protein
MSSFLIFARDDLLCVCINANVNSCVQFLQTYLLNADIPIYSVQRLICQGDRPGLRCFGAWGQMEDLSVFIILYIRIWCFSYPVNILSTLAFIY